MILEPPPQKKTNRPHTLTRPLCSVEAPPVVILLLAAIDAPESSAAAATTTMGADAARRPTERESRAEAMRSRDGGGWAFVLLASCNRDGGCEAWDDDDDDDHSDV